MASESDRHSTDGYDHHTHNSRPSQLTRHFLEEMKPGRALFYLKVTEGCRLPKSTAGEIFSMMKVLLRTSFQALGEEIEKELKSQDAAPTSDTLSMLLQADDLVQLIFAETDSKHQLENYIRAHLPYTEPKEVVLKQDGKPKKPFCYVPVGPLLHNLMTSPEIYESVTQNTGELATDNAIIDICDGDYSQTMQHELAVDGSQYTVFLLLYTDELELNNPLGSSVGKNKILVVYSSILNLHV